MNDVGALAEFLPLASRSFLPTRPDVAALVQGLADRLIEESGGSPDRLVAMWGDEVRSGTRELAPDHFEANRKDGRTLTLELALTFFDEFLTGRPRVS